MEGAAAVAVPAADAVLCAVLKRQIVLLREAVAEARQIVILIDKADIQPDYEGFQVPDEFVVGYGLDYDEKYRNLPYVGVLKPEVYTK